MIEILKDLGDDDDIYCYFFTKEDADERAGDQVEDEFRFEGSHWAKIVEQMEADEGISQVADEAFDHYVDKMVTKVSK
jgi:hypothetical protein